MPRPAVGQRFARSLAGSNREGIGLLLRLMDCLNRLNALNTARMIDIETFPNPNPGRDYLVQHISEEFTSVCPKTGHPDFARVVLTFVPSDICVELKAYKLYLHSFRNQGIFFEAATNKIFNDIWELLNPRWMRLETIWSGRGGIHSNVIVEDAAPGYSGPKTPLFQG